MRRLMHPRFDSAECSDLGWLSARIRSLLAFTKLVYISLIILVLYNVVECHVSQNSNVLRALVAYAGHEGLLEQCHATDPPHMEQRMRWPLLSQNLRLVGNHWSYCFDGQG